MTVSEEGFLGGQSGVKFPLPKRPVYINTMFNWFPSELPFIGRASEVSDCSFLSVGDRDNNQTLKSNLTKFGAKVGWCKISYNFVKDQIS